MDSAAFWEENGSVRIPVKFESFNSSDGPITLQPCKEEQSLFQFCDGNLNFATVATSEDDEFNFNKKKISRDPMSHRIIEKRRRDRMNNCLADLSRLIPADYLKKGRGRIEKTEIIEMAIQHMKHLQTRASKQTECDGSEHTPPQEEPPVDRPYQSCGSGPINTEHYRLGYHECLSETMHFMVEVEGFYAGDPLCVQLINHLQKHCDKILKGDRLNCPRAHGNETTSNSSGSSGDYGSSPHSSSDSPNSSSDPKERGYEDDVVDLTGSGRLTGPNLVSHNLKGTSPPSASLYKFKNNIKQRFSAERLGEGDPAKRRRYETAGEATRRHSDTCSSPSSPDPPPSPGTKTSNVPIFALHTKGSYYVPLTLDADTLTPYFDELNLSDENSRQTFENPALVLHPVTISVNFKQSINHKIDTRPNLGLSSTNFMWKNESSGFVSLPNWYHNERHAMAIPPYNKNV